MRRIKNSQILNIMLAIIMIILIVNWVLKSSQTDCFNWFDYTMNFGTLFGSMAINFLAAYGD